MIEKKLEQNKRDQRETAGIFLFLQVFFEPCKPFRRPVGGLDNFPIPVFPHGPEPVFVIEEDGFIAVRKYPFYIPETALKAF